MARTGRPRIGDEAPKVSMRRDQVENLRLIAALEGVSMATIIRRAIDHEVKRVLKRRAA
jgi:hypothetical protein